MCTHGHTADKRPPLVLRAFGVLPVASSFRFRPLFRSTGICCNSAAMVSSVSAFT